MTMINGTTLADMTINMLERTAMVLAEPAADGDEHPPATRYARITYRGPSWGTLVLGATDGFLRELAASLLGVDTAEVNIDTHGGDALKEMANIVGGSMILALSGDACEYSLGLPELMATKDGSRQGGGAASAECIVIAEGGALRVYWHEASIAKAV
jgi:CheY-specific phosphatase CheX